MPSSLYGEEHDCGLVRTAPVPLKTRTVADYLAVKRPYHGVGPVITDHVVPIPIYVLNSPLMKEFFCFLNHPVYDQLSSSGSYWAEITLLPTELPEASAYL